MIRSPYKRRMQASGSTADILRQWPDGVLRRISRAAFDYVNRSHRYARMTPQERETEARGYDAMHGSKPTKEN